MNNGITEQLKGLQREKQQLEQLLSGDANWRAYRELVAAQPDRTEKDIVYEIGLPENLADKLDNNRLFQARLKILDAIDLLTKLVANANAAPPGQAYAASILPAREGEAERRAAANADAPLKERIAIVHNGANGAMPVHRKTALPSPDLPANARLAEAFTGGGDKAEPHKGQRAGIENKPQGNETAALTAGSFCWRANGAMALPSAGLQSAEKTKCSTVANAPSPSSEASRGEPEVDDLTRISGIDRGIALQLRRHGVRTFAEIASWTPAYLAVIGAILELGSKPREQDWIGQANNLCRGAAAAPPVPTALRAPDRPDSAVNILPFLASGGKARLGQHMAAAQTASHRPETAASCDGNEHPDTAVGAQVGKPDIPLPFAAKQDELIVGSALRQPPLAETAANDDRPDDLNRIKNITVGDFATLAELGLTSFAALAAISAHDVKRLKNLLTDGKRLHKEQWIEQAAMLAQGRLTYFAQRQIHKLIPATVAMPAQQAWTPQLPAQLKESEIPAQSLELAAQDSDRKDWGRERRDVVENTIATQTSVEDQAVTIAKVAPQDDNDNNYNDDNIAESFENTPMDRGNLTLRAPAKINASVLHVGDLRYRASAQKTEAFIFAGTLSPDLPTELSSGDEKMSTYLPQSDALKAISSSNDGLKFAQERQAHLNESLDRLQRRIAEIDIPPLQEQPASTKDRNPISPHEAQRNEFQPLNASASANTSAPSVKAAEAMPQLLTAEYDITAQEEIVATSSDRIAAAAVSDDRLDAADFKRGEAQVKILSKAEKWETAVADWTDLDSSELSARDRTDNKPARSLQNLATRMQRHALRNNKKRYPIARYAFSAEEASVRIVRHDDKDKIGTPDGTPAREHENLQPASAERSKSNALTGRFLGALTGRDKK